MDLTKTGDVHATNITLDVTGSALGSPQIAATESKIDLRADANLTIKGSGVVLEVNSGNNVTGIAGGTALGPADFALVYGVDALQKKGLTGAGRSIAVVARTNFPDADVTKFSALYVSGAPLDVQRVFAGADPGILAIGEVTEVLLDAEWAAGIAPGARVNVVIGDQSSDIPGAIEKAVEDRLGDVVSVSFGTSGTGSCRGR